MNDQSIDLISPSMKTQLKSNLLAIISLIVAISALGYNSWRNEVSEDNRNFRAAGFEIMREAAQLQLLVDTSTYTEKPEARNAIRGWVSVNLILSLSELMTPEIKSEAKRLKAVWTENWSNLLKDRQANKAVSDANARLVEAVRLHLRSLG